MKRGAALLACAIACLARAESATNGHTATLATLFPASEVAALEKTLPADRAVHFRVREPPGNGRSGVLVFISANDSGELPQAWAEVLDRMQLVWVAADGYGNARPTAERMLVAVMALKLAQKLRPSDSQRLYISGFSGGGRVASRALTQFPRLFTGAFCIAGADYSMPPDERLRTLVASRRLALLTGNRDFNQRELRSVHRKYLDAGVPGVLLMDERGFGHELASAAQLERAIGFLDQR